MQLTGRGKNSRDGFYYDFTRNGETVCMIYDYAARQGGAASSIAIHANTRSTDNWYCENLASRSLTIYQRVAGKPSESRPGWRVSWLNPQTATIRTDGGSVMAEYDRGSYVFYYVGREVARIRAGQGVRMRPMRAVDLAAEVSDSLPEDMLIPVLAFPVLDMYHI